MRLIYLLVPMVLFVPSSLAQGQIVAQYTARIGAQDHVNSAGERLDSVAAILRQDRANFHRFDRADAEDEADAFFVEPHERARFERLLSRGIVRPDVSRAIINANPLVRVTVHPTRAYVELVEP